MKTAVILISGRGSNMAALLAAGLPLEIKAVISNRPDAAGLALAAARGIPTVALDHHAFADRAAFDAELMRAIDAHAPDLVLLAGFMRIMTDACVRRYEGRMINIHPALLPAFTGLNTHRRALAAGVRVHGCTVHFVTPELDVGPIIIQAAVAVHPDDTEQTLAARVLEQEHRIYPAAVRWLAEDRVRRLPDGTVAIDGAAPGSGALLSPWEDL